MTRRIEGYGISAALLPGWDVRIHTRAESDVMVTGPEPAPVGGFVNPMLHDSTALMPPLVGGYGSHVVPILGQTDVFLALVEFNRADADAAMFRPGVPRLRQPQFDRQALQRGLPFRSGVQQFFTVSGRAFCLFCVLGSHIRRSSLVPRANEFLSGIEVQP